MQLVAFLGVISSASAAVLEKFSLGGRGVTYKNFSAVSFLAALVVAAAAFAVFRPPLTADLFFGIPGLLMLFTTATILVSNIIYHRALKKELLTELQMLKIVAAIPVILFSFVLFADERNLAVLSLALIAACAVLWAHWQNHHFLFKKDVRPYLWWVIFIGPLEAAAFKEALMVWHPVALQFVREIIIVPVLFLLYYQNIKRASGRSLQTIFLAGMLGTLGSLLFYTSYQQLGIIFTVLIFSLQPLLTYATSLVFLREPFHIKKFVAFVVVLTAVAAINIV